MPLLRDTLRVGLLDALWWRRQEHGPLTLWNLRHLIQECDNHMGRTLMQHHRQEFDSLRHQRSRLKRMLRRLESGLRFPWL